MSQGSLYLIPVPLGEMAASEALPQPVCECAAQLQYFIAENAKSARVFLKSLPSKTLIQEISITELNEHTPPTALPGASRHQQGLAIDFGDNGRTIQTRDNACFLWLSAHAGSYGFANLSSEPWHWSIDGR